MRIEIAAIGRLRDRAPLDMVADYHKRLRWRVSVREREGGGGDRAQEGRFLLDATRACAVRIALDERGKHLDSPALAVRLGAWRDEGRLPIGIIIGGAGGLSNEVRATADLLLAFGALTWPHLLVRVMLFEQLYRAQQILAGHPYHRA